MTTKDTTAGIILFRGAGSEIEILLAHPGGPFWKNKDTHGWSIPKGIVEQGEDVAEAALREFAEEVGCTAPPGELLELPILDIGKKFLAAFALSGDLDVTDFGSKEMCSNTFEMEWPPKSGKRAVFPEVDRLSWFNLTESETKLHKKQVPILSFLWDRICD